MYHSVFMNLCVDVDVCVCFVFFCVLYVCIEHDTPNSTTNRLLSISDMQ